MVPGGAGTGKWPVVPGGAGTDKWLVVPGGTSAGKNGQWFRAARRRCGIRARRVWGATPFPTPAAAGLVGEFFTALLR